MVKFNLTACFLLTHSELRVTQSLRDWCLQQSASRSFNDGWKRGGSLRTSPLRADARELSRISCGHRGVQSSIPQHPSRCQLQDRSPHIRSRTPCAPQAFPGLLPDLGRAEHRLVHPSGQAAVAEVPAALQLSPSFSFPPLPSLRIEALAF